MDKNLPAVYGIDYERGLRNCMGDAAFYAKILTMFLNDGCFERACAAKASGDFKALFAAMHELKGVSGNAALMELYAEVVPLVELLRHGSEDADLIDKMFCKVEKSYKRACEGASFIIAG